MASEGRGRNSREVSQAGISSGFQTDREALVMWALLGMVCARTSQGRVALALEGALLATPLGSTWTWEVWCFAIPAQSGDQVS